MIDGEKAPALYWLLDLSYVCPFLTRHFFLINHFTACNLGPLSWSVWWKARWVSGYKSNLFLKKGNTFHRRRWHFIQIQEKRHSVRFRVTLCNIAQINSKIMCSVLQSVIHTVEIIVCTLDYKKCCFRNRIQAKSGHVSKRMTKGVFDNSKFTDH